MTDRLASIETGKVLLVDDRNGNLSILSSVLTSRGYEIRQANNGRLALEIARAEVPDIVLLDVAIPDMDGYQVCQQLKADSRTKDIPVVFISTFNETEVIAKAFASGGSEYITRPFNTEEVIIRIQHQLAIARLKARLKATNQRLKILASKDDLTKVANRYYFNRYFRQEWRRAYRENYHLALILGDIDYFKQYNDRFGHQAGDICLRRVARAIDSAVKRPADLVARYGGEEFAVILPQTAGANALNVALEIHRAVEMLQISHPDSAVSDFVSLSLGVASMLPTIRTNRTQLISEADRALYQAKTEGRNRAVLYD
ncbi:diguanylate cyclase [Myxosarcina sp. GI1]|uniref:diguanylate cyclase n=1 Tax=Myxosarcina sp. GI1 TaxID=1541065 RepID=UPI00055A814D|nr:diguanylate cyclase [Myxosarcina sp. GI1]